MMLPEFARGSVLWEAVFGAAILGGSLVIAFLVHPFLTRLAKVFTGKTKTALDDLLLAAMSRPLFLFVLVQGLFLALTVISFLDRWQALVNRAWLVSGSVVLLYGLQRLLNAALLWYAQELATKSRSQLDEKLLPLVRRFLTGFVYVLGGLLILDNLGIELSPLLAGLGLGGLAVALALQPTLSNLFASTYVVADGTIGVGDFIELSDSLNGRVRDIGWRTTKVETPTGNLVIIPNSKLADSIIINYQLPTPEMNVFITCGVAYESDLAHVERVCHEVAKQVIAQLPEAVVVKEFEPSVFYREFGDSNVNFVVVVRAQDRDASFILTHELIKALHSRFAVEGIESNYPVRKLVLGGPATTETGAGESAGGGGAAEEDERGPTAP